MFLKLVCLDGQRDFPVCACFIPKGSSFTFKGVVKGRYDVCYRSLSRGNLARTEILPVGSDIDAIGQEAFSVHHFTVIFDDVAMVLFLLENEAFISTMSHWNESPLDSAARRGIKDMVEAIQSKMTLP